MAADTIAAGMMFAFSDHFKNMVLLSILILIDNSGGIGCLQRRGSQCLKALISYEWGM